jgi:hypothetical protein
VWKCGFCKREASAKFEPGFQTKLYLSENRQFEPFLTMDCRNLEFTGFEPKVCYSQYYQERTFLGLTLIWIWS